MTPTTPKAGPAAAALAALGAFPKGDNMPDTAPWEFSDGPLDFLPMFKLFNPIIGAKATVLLGFLHRESNGEEIDQTIEDISEMTGFTVSATKTALKPLLDFGLLTEAYTRVNRTKVRLLTIDYAKVRLFTEFAGSYKTTSALDAWEKFLKNNEASNSSENSEIASGFSEETGDPDDSPMLERRPGRPRRSGNQI